MYISSNAVAVAVTFALAVARTAAVALAWVRAISVACEAIVCAVAVACMCCWYGLMTPTKAKSMPPTISTHASTTSKTATVFDKPCLFDIDPGPGWRSGWEGC